MAEATGNQDHECQGGHNCDGGDIAIDVDAVGGDSSSESWADSNADSESVSSAEASADNSVATTVNFSNPKSTTVRNVASPDTPNVYPSAPCRIARSAGLSIAGGALSGGSSVEDPECTLRETARTFQYLGVPEIGLHLLCTNSVVINGRRDKKGNLEEGEPAPIGSAECLRLVREFQGNVVEPDAEAAVQTQLEIIREQHDRTESELLARVDDLEDAIAEARKPRATPKPIVTQQTIQQPYLTEQKRSKLASLLNDEGEE
jgi:hypothetical protein